MHGSRVWPMLPKVRSVADRPTGAAPSGAVWHCPASFRRPHLSEILLHQNRALPRLPCIPIGELVFRFLIYERARPILKTILCGPAKPNPPRNSIPSLRCKCMCGRCDVSFFDRCLRIEIRSKIHRSILAAGPSHRHPKHDRGELWFGSISDADLSNLISRAERCHMDTLSRILELLLRYRVRTLLLIMRDSPIPCIREVKFHEEWITLNQQSIGMAIPVFI